MSLSADSQCHPGYEPNAFCHSEPFTSCHSEGSKQPKNLIQLRVAYAEGQQSNLAGFLNPTYGDLKKSDFEPSLPWREGVRGRENSLSPSPNLSRQGRGRLSKVSVSFIPMIRGCELA